jgi:D-lactate dehydrogenase
MTIKMLVFDFRPTEEDFFKNNKLDNFDITFFKESLNEQNAAKIPQELKDSTNIVSVFIESEVNDNVLSEFKNLRLLTTRSTGVNHINLRACQQKNIAVINVENYGSTSVVQYTLGLMTALVRNIPAANDYVKRAERECTEFVGRDLTKLTLGIAGTGATGAGVAKIARAIGMDVIAYDVVEKKELIKDGCLKYVDFETLIKKSDIITLHLPYTGNNLHMFAAREFGMMKKNSYFINTSRGELVMLADLYEAVKSGHLKGAALDVLTCESYSFNCNKLAQNTPEPSSTCASEVQTVAKMSKLPNVIITPHIAYDTQDSIDYILDRTFAGIMDFIRGGSKYRVV